MSEQGKVVIAMSVSATIFFITEPFPLPTVALLIAVSEVLFGLAKPNEVAKSFFNDSVFFIMGSLMLAVAIVKQKLDKRIALAILKVTGPKVERVVFGIVTVAALMASVIGEHTTAAMLLPVGITLVTLSSRDPNSVKNLAALLMFSISYGSSIAGIGTPSGGARNVIMMEYWRSLFGINIDYLQWIKYAYPMVLIQIPVAVTILLSTFKPEIRDLSPAVNALRREVEKQGKMSRREWLTVAIFILTLTMWITLSDELGLGTIALLGSSMYLITGLVEWEDVNRGMNWGVVLLYAGAISLGVMMMDTGAAKWLAESFLSILALFKIDGGIPLFGAVSVLTTLVTNMMSNGATVAVLGPITLNMASISSTSVVAMGFVTAISSAFAYLTVIGTPACTIIYSSGYLKTTDFFRAGWKMAVASIALVLLFSATYWKMVGLPA